MSLYGDVFDKQPVPFHWINGGVFKTATLLAKGKRVEDLEDPDEGIEFVPPRGIFQHHQQLSAHHARPEPRH